MSDRWNVLVVEDPQADLTSVFAAAKANVLHVRNASEALAAVAERPVDLIVVDRERLGDRSRGIIEHRGEPRRPPTIVLCDDPHARVQALELGADDVVSTSISAAELLTRARFAHSRAGIMTALLAENRRLGELSITDGLTQVANHYAFQERLREEFRRSQRYDDPLALILLDVDHFKLINDQFGHPVGDLVLRQLAEVLKQAVRETDFVARYGGEEFGVILPNTHLAGALTVAERISHDIHCMQLSALKQMRVTASFGISCFPTRSISSGEEMLKAADEAMYRAKNEGRNKISLHQPALLAV